jgi:uncharacterized RDD family membrane protein YckC
MNANPYSAPRAAVSDVKDSTELELAGRGVRLGAALLDGLIASIVWIPLFFGIDWSMTPGEMPQVSAGPITLSVLLFIGWLVITIMFVARNGQTIAKKLLDIRVVRSDGSHATLGRIFWLRNFVNGLLGIIPLYSIVDLLFIFGDSRQCIHDKIADTIVVVA